MEYYLILGQPNDQLNEHIHERFMNEDVTLVWHRDVFGVGGVHKERQVLIEIYTDIIHYYKPSE